LAGVEYEIHANPNTNSSNFRWAVCGLVESLTVGRIRECTSQVLRYVNLLDVHIFKLLSEGTVPLADGPFDVQSNLAVRGQQRDGFLDAYSLYQVEAKAPDESEAWSVRLEMVGTWAVEEGAPEFDEEHLNCFAVAIGSMTLHPYARENVQSAVSRLGYPPFTLDMISSPTGGADDDVVEISPSDPLDFSV